MEIKKVRVHTCNESAQGALEGKCRCRRFVTQDTAAELIEQGIAANVIESYKTVEIEQQCPICDNVDQLKKSCKLCGSTGKVSDKRIVYEYGPDIYMRPFLKTPRTATIEKNHFEYAYIKLDKNARKRIELYHQTDQIALVKLGAQLRDSTGEILFDGTPEPTDNPKKGEGRRYDYGRKI